MTVKILPALASGNEYIVCIYDIAACCYEPPIVVPSVVQFERDLRAQLSDPKNLDHRYVKYANDFRVVVVGEWNPARGLVSGFTEDSISRVESFRLSELIAGKD